MRRVCLALRYLRMASLFTRKATCYMQLYRAGSLGFGCGLALDSKSGIQI
jgi:hypothetical protein